MQALGRFKLHILALIVVAVSDFIGKQTIGILVLLPLLYAMVFGAILSVPKFKILSIDEQNRAAHFMPIAMLILVAYLGLGIGPNLHQLAKAGLALIMQEFGHFFGTIILGLPMALLLKLGREAIGACYSIDREPNVAIIAEKYGIDSPEGRGVMGMYICGTVFGAAWISVLVGVIAQLGWFSPQALAMGTGVGSASMMVAGIGSIVAVYPDQAQVIQGFAGAANLMTTILGIYFALFVSLPVMVWLYEKITGDRRETKK